MKTQVSYGMIQDYILENDLNDNDVIMLHPSDYDTVATEFISEHDLMIYKPVEILGISIVEDTTGDAKKNNIYLLQELYAS